MKNLKELLIDCRVESSVLKLNTKVSTEDLKALYELLRVDLQDGNIPHYKVVAAKYLSGGKMPPNDYVSKLRGANKSFAELYVSLQSVIIGEVFGSDDVTAEAMKQRGKYGVLLSNETNIESDNGSLLWSGTGTNFLQESLVMKIPIIRTENVNNSIQFVVAKGKGYSDFVSCMPYLLQQEGFVPIAQYFNLSPYILLKRYKEGDIELGFTYKDNINESVLTKILRDYALDGLEV